MEGRRVNQQAFGLPRGPAGSVASRPGSDPPRGPRIEEMPPPGATKVKGPGSKAKASAPAAVKKGFLRNNKSAPLYEKGSENGGKEV